MDLSCQHILSDEVVIENEDSHYVPIQYFIKTIMNEYLSEYPTHYDFQTDHILKPIKQWSVSVANNSNHFSSGSIFHNSNINIQNVTVQQNNTIYEIAASETNLPVSTSTIPYALVEEYKNQFDEDLSLNDITIPKDITHTTLSCNNLRYEHASSSVVENNSEVTLYENNLYFTQINVTFDQNCNRGDIRALLYSSNQNAFKLFKTDGTLCDFTIPQDSKSINIDCIIRTQEIQTPELVGDIHIRILESDAWNCSLRIQKSLPMKHYFNIKNKPHIDATSIQTSCINKPNTWNELYATTSFIIHTTFTSDGIPDIDPVLHFTSSTNEEISMEKKSCVQGTDPSEFLWTYEYIIPASSTEEEHNYYLNLNNHNHLCTIKESEYYTMDW